MSWYLTSIISFLLFSIQFFIFKIAAEKKADFKLLTFWFMLASLISSAVFFVLVGVSISGVKLLAILSFIAGITFVFATIFRLESLKHLPSSTAFLVFDLKVLLITLLSIFLFKDFVSSTQLIGIILALVAGFFVVQKQTGENLKYEKFNLGLLLAVGVALCLAVNAAAIKQIVVLGYHSLAFIMFASFFNSVSSLVIYKLDRKEILPDVKKYSIKMGILAGILNFSAFYFEYLALKTGSLAVVTAVISLSTFGAIALSTTYFREKIGVKRGIGLVIGIISLILLK